MAISPQKMCNKLASNFRHDRANDDEFEVSSYMASIMTWVFTVVTVAHPLLWVKRDGLRAEGLRMKIRVHCLWGNPAGPFSSMWYAMICYLDASAN